MPASRLRRENSQGRGASFMILIPRCQRILATMANKNLNRSDFFLKHRPKAREAERSEGLLALTALLAPTRALQALGGAQFL